jgi:acetoin utilization protein AcuC
VPRAWTHLLAEAAGERLDPATEIPQSWRDDVVARGLRSRPPTHMTEGGWTGFTAWDPFTESRVDRAVARTRRASYPLFGLDPDDPRD